MVSLLELAEITERGVTFASPRDGSPMLLTPEQSIAIQNRLGPLPAALPRTCTVTWHAAVCQQQPC